MIEVRVMSNVKQERVGVQIVLCEGSLTEVAGTRGFLYSWYLPWWPRILKAADLAPKWQQPALQGFYADANMNAQETNTKIEIGCTHLW